MPAWLRNNILQYMRSLRASLIRCWRAVESILFQEVGAMEITALLLFLHRSHVCSMSSLFSPQSYTLLLLWRLPCMFSYHPLSTHLCKGRQMTFTCGLHNLIRIYSHRNFDANLSFSFSLFLSLSQYKDPVRKRVPQKIWKFIIVTHIYYAPSRLFLYKAESLISWTFAKKEENLIFFQHLFRSQFSQLQQCRL